MNAISFYPFLKTLTFHQTKMSFLATTIMMEELPDCKNIDTLILADNNLKNEVGPLLCAMLSQNKSLVNLDLSSNQLSAHCVGQVFGALTNQNPILKRLDLSNTNLTDDIITPLVNVITQNISLTRLILWDNKLSEAAGEQVVDAVAKNKTLRQLEFAGNGLTLQQEQTIAKITFNNGLAQFSKGETKAS